VPNDHCLGSRLDDDRYAVVWAELESLGVPLYIHQGAPQPLPALQDYPELNGAHFGWAAATGAHVMRLISTCAGISLACPRTISDTHTPRCGPRSHM